MINDSLQGEREGERGEELVSDVIHWVWLGNDCIASLDLYQLTRINVMELKPLCVCTCGVCVERDTLIHVQDLQIITTIT